MINASRLWDLADAAGQLCGGERDLVEVLQDALEARREAESAGAVIHGLQALLGEQRELLARARERVRELERRDLAAIVCAFHAGVLTREEAHELAAPRLPNLQPGDGPMPRPPRRPWLTLARGALSALAALAIGAWS